MNRQEYMAALHRALSVLPDEERGIALRFYEEYFDDAGPEHEQEVIEEFGDPAQVAAQILADYRELVTAIPVDGDNMPPPPPPPEQPQKTHQGVNPWLLVLLVLLAIPIGILLAAALFSAVIGVLAAGFAIPLALVVSIFAAPFGILVAGVALSAFSFVLWDSPASALVTLGGGLALIAVGILLGVLVVKLCIRFVPPLVRALVDLLRRGVDFLKKRFQGGKSS